MTHRILNTDEASWPREAKLWAHVQQFSPRRGHLRGHVVAFLVGIILAAVVVAIEYGVRHV